MVSFDRFNCESASWHCGISRSPIDISRGHPPDDGLADPGQHAGLLQPPAGPEHPPEGRPEQNQGQDHRAADQHLQGKSKIVSRYLLSTKYSIIYYTLNVNKSF